jgi:hypothetical protein
MRKSILSTTALLASFCIAAPVFALHKYTFTGYCDGITLNQSAGIVATGYHTGCSNNDYAGGLEAVVHGVPGNQWIITTTDEANAPGYVEMFVINEAALTWELYVEDTSDSLTFELINSGTLTIGAPPPAVPGLHPTFYK